MKKNIFLLLTIFLLLIAYSNTQDTVEADSAEFGFAKEKTAERVAEKAAEKQEKLIMKLEKELSKIGLTFENLNENGDLYFNDNQVVIQLSSINKNNVKFKKLEKIVRDLNKFSPTEYIIEETKYSSNQLVEMQKNFSKQTERLNLTNNYILVLDSKNNNLKLTIENLTKENEKLLQEIYGDAISITRDEELSVKSTIEHQAFKARTSDFNSQGAGIGIHTKFSENGKNYTHKCSTAGVAQKGSDLWVITAGHCDDYSDTFYQYGSVLGSTHLDAFASDYDFLLIKVNGSPLKRFASNGLYSVSADSSTGYDSKLTGSFSPYEGLRVCKVGITTNKTCGVVTKKRYQSGSFRNGLVYFEVENEGQVVSSAGDSGGAWYTQSLPYRLVGIHAAGNTDENSTKAFVTPWVEVSEKYNLTLYTKDTTSPMN